MSKKHPTAWNYTGARIRDFRRADELTQAQLAEMSGIDQADISKWERGVYHPTIDSLRRLATALGVPWKDLAED